MDNQDEQSWQLSDLPPEMINLISRFMSVSDLANLRAVCRSWKEVGNRRYRLSTCTEATMLSSPTLITVTDRRCTFYEPLHGYVTHSKEIPELFGAEIIGSGFGWLILGHKSDPGRIFLFNLATLTKVELPKCPTRNCYLKYAWLSAPLNSPGCLIIAMVERDDMYWMIKRNETDWTQHEHPNDKLLSLACAPVIFQGKLYCLDFHGRIVVLDLINGPRLECPFKSPPPFRHRNLMATFQRTFLVACETELWAVLLNHQNQVTIYGLNLDTPAKKWRKIEDLGDKMLFVGQKLSLVKDTCVRSLANKIYFPRFDWSGYGLVYDVGENTFMTLLKDNDANPPSEEEPLGFIKELSRSSAWYQIDDSKWEDGDISSWQRAGQ